MKKRNRYIYPPHIRAAEVIHAMSWALIALLAGIALAILGLELAHLGPLSQLGGVR